MFPIRLLCLPSFLGLEVPNTPPLPALIHGAGGSQYTSCLPSFLGLEVPNTPPLPALIPGAGGSQYTSCLPSFLGLEVPNTPLAWPHSWGWRFPIHLLPALISGQPRRASSLFKGESIRISLHA
ncbi:hypothetical protein ACOMHN_027427 [Nucella lapillus]